MFAYLDVADRGCQREDERTTTGMRDEGMRDE
jgi:hypothetical protein